MTAATTSPTPLIPQSETSSNPPTFDDFWKAYPKRLGGNPKAPARTSWDRAVRKGAAPEAILASTQAYARDPATKTGTEFVPMAVTWLNQRRWEDHQVAPASALSPREARVFVEYDTPAWCDWEAHYLNGGAPNGLRVRPPCITEYVNGRRREGWYFPSERPPGQPHQIGEEPAQKKARDPNRNPEVPIGFSGHVGLPLDSSVL